MELAKCKRRRVQREEERRCKREEGGSSGSEDLLLSSSSSDSSTSSTPSPPPSPYLSSKVVGGVSKSSTMTKVVNPPIREMKMSTSNDTVRSRTNGDDYSSDSSLYDNNSLTNSNEKSRATTETMTTTKKNGGTDNNWTAQRPLLSSLVWGTNDDDDTSSDDAMKRLAKRRAVARKKEMRSNNNAVGGGCVSTLSMSSTSDTAAISRDGKDDGANQRPNNIESLEVDKIHPTLLCDNAVPALLTTKKETTTNQSLKCDDATKTTSILDNSSDEVNYRSDAILLTAASLSNPTASNNSTINHPSNTLTKTAVKSNDPIIHPDKSMPPSTSPSSNTEPIVGREVRTNSNINWSTHAGCLLLRTVGDYSPRDKIAGFDLDNTIVNWRCAGWPSRLEHYELWNHDVIEKCRILHDSGYRLVIFTNQGGIRSALTGKRAMTFRSLIDWIAFVIDRPLFAVASTKTDSGYHKGSPSMWNIFEEKCNLGKQVNPNTSFFVGDADGTGDATADAGRQQHQQTGTDKLFAKNVGDMRNTTMEYFTPGQYFGASNVERRRLSSSLSVGSPPVIPQAAIQSRAALLGGYTSGPICLILVGVISVRIQSKMVHPVHERQSKPR
jgi:bifunctional polynucleotide phosphatase/kinase